MNNETKLVKFYDTQAHGAARDVSVCAKLALAEWASNPDVYFAALIERSLKVFDPTTNKLVWLETDTSVMNFETLEGLEQFAKNTAEEPVEPNRAVKISKFEWDLGFNLIP